LSTVPLEAAKAHWQAGRSQAALAEGWLAYDAAPDGLAEKSLLAKILRRHPEFATPERRESLLALLCDPDVEPGAIAGAGWSLLTADGTLRETDGVAALAARLESDALALALLGEDYVADLAMEQVLTRLRAWLLTSGSWRDRPRLSAALTTQALRNGGAWPFGEDERRCLESDDGFAGAYLPKTADRASPADFSNPVTRAVAAQYEGWPYPSWRRITAVPPERLAQYVGKLDPDGPDGFPAPANVLIAGCGTGREAAQAVQQWPGERFTAIDISDASLAYAAERFAAIGLQGVQFRRVDLHDVATLGRPFDAILCSGVLHHLPDPERGWAALTAALKPGGVIRIMVYSKIARLGVRALRKAVEDLDGQAMSDDLLREVRRRISKLPAMRHFQSRDFFTLAGVHDLFMHRHEDPFDLPRIRRALDVLGLQLLRFGIPRNDVRARYHAQNPHDPLQRDFDGWIKLERESPWLFSGMYEFWCRKNGA
jgi:SAM-dependent methyltransferase